MKRKVDKLKDEKKEKKKKIEEKENELEDSEARTEAANASKEEVAQQLLCAQKEIEAHANRITELKSKLTEAMDTLKKNSETIEFLNKSLTEA